MPSLIASFLAAGLATLAQAYTAPGAQTWGPLLTPDTTHAVTQGETFTVTWDPEDHPTDGVTVSLVLCHGPSTNCVPSDTAIASGIPAAQKSFDWQVPCDLTPGAANTNGGYGMMIIVDGTGEFQYSTQFTCFENDKCSSSGPSSSSSTSSPVIAISASVSVSGTVTVSSGGTSIILGPPASQTGPVGPWGTSGNGTWSTTASGTGASATVITTGGYSTLPGTTVLSSTLATATVATTAAGQTSGTTSAPGTSASTFTGGAGQVGYSAAGLVIAGAVAVLAL